MGKLTVGWVMKRVKTSVTGLALVLLFLAGAAQAQTTIFGGKCSGRVYLAQEVTRRAKITGTLAVPMTKEALAHEVHGRIVIEAVLCRTGRVTNMRVIEGLPFGMTERVLGVLSELEFVPAEVNWHTVSQKQRFEFGFNERGSEINPEGAASRLVEAVEVVGNRGVTKDQLFSWIKTRPGEPFSFHQVELDLGAVVATGYFDKLRTSVKTEEGPRGGVVIVFEVVEVPVIGETKFEGLNVDPSLILDTLSKHGINLKSGATYSIDTVREAVRIIKQALESRGERNVKVNVHLENLTATRILLTFVISND